MENTSGDINLQLWSEHPVDKTQQAPETWIHDLADQVEIKRLCDMKVLDEQMNVQMNSEEN